MKGAEVREVDYPDRKLYVVKNGEVFVRSVPVRPPLGFKP